MVKKRRNAAETKVLIRDVFIDLYGNHNIEDISIKMIADKAGVNRGTFYIYYNDIYDLKKQIEDEIYNLIASKLTEAMHHIFLGDSDKAFMQDIEFFKEHLKKFSVFIGTYGKTDIIERIKEKARGLLLENMSVNDEKKQLLLEYIIEYLVSAQAGIIVYWINNDLNLETEDLKFLIINAIKRGPYTVMNELVSKS